MEEKNSHGSLACTSACFFFIKVKVISMVGSIYFLAFVGVEKTVASKRYGRMR